MAEELSRPTNRISEQITHIVVATATHRIRPNLTEAADLDAARTRKALGSD
jgi:hypothetical protein